MEQLTAAQKAQALMLLADECFSREIRNRLGGVHHATILRLQKKAEETGSAKCRVGSGRPRKLNVREECECVRKIKTGECSTAVAVQKKLRTDDEIIISSNTVR